MRKTLSMLGIAMAATFATGNLSAQCLDLPPIGTVYTCYFVNGTKVIGLPGGPVPVGSTGSATVYVIGHNYNPCEALLSPNQFASTSDAGGELGRVQTALAPGSPVSRLTGTRPGTLIPYNIELNLNLTATVGTTTYVSANPLTLRAQNVNSLPPRGARLIQDPTDAAVVQFTTRDNPTTPGFSLSKVSAEITP